MALTDNQVAEIQKNWYVIEDSEEGTLVLRGLYENTGSVQVAVVAVVNPLVGDWAAYVGGSSTSRTERETLIEVARYGNKNIDLARLYFRRLFELGLPWRS